MTPRMKRVVAGFLVDNLIGRSATRGHKHVRGIAPDARDALARAAWQGDVQGLQADIERIVAAARDGDTITGADVRAVMQKKPPR